MRYRRPRNRVVPVGVPRRQLLAIQHDVVLELLLDDDDHDAVESNCHLVGIADVRVSTGQLSQQYGVNGMFIISFVKATFADQ